MNSPKFISMSFAPLQIFLYIIPHYIIMPSCPALWTLTCLCYLLCAAGHTCRGIAKHTRNCTHFKVLRDMSGSELGGSGTPRAKTAEEIMGHGFAVACIGIGVWKFKGPEVARRMLEEKRLGSLGTKSVTILLYVSSFRVWWRVQVSCSQRHILSEHMF